MWDHSCAVLEDIVCRPQPDRFYYVLSRHRREISCEQPHLVIFFLACHSLEYLEDKIQLLEILRELDQNQEAF